MEFEQRVNIIEGEILSPLQLYVEMQKLKWEVARLVSHAESERGDGGTFQRAIKRLKENIVKVEEEYRLTMFDSERGVIVKLDRLMTESAERKNFKKQIVSLWITLISLIISFIFAIVQRHFF